MRIYLAGSWKQRKTVVPEARAALRAHGYIVDCRWIDKDGLDEQQEAIDDLVDIDNSDALLVYNPEGVVSEGKAFEQGYAYAQGMPIVVVGPRTCVFQHLERVIHVDTIEDAINALKEHGMSPAYHVTW
jgi:nucleoside 2-deoxyribosyltransferase